MLDPPGILLLFLVYVVLVAAVVVSGVALVVTVDPSVAVSVDCALRRLGIQRREAETSASIDDCHDLGTKNARGLYFREVFFSKRKNCEEPPRVQSFFLAHLLLYTLLPGPLKQLWMMILISWLSPLSPSGFEKNAFSVVK